MEHLFYGTASDFAAEARHKDTNHIVSKLVSPMMF